MFKKIIAIVVVAFLSVSVVYPSVNSAEAASVKNQYVKVNKGSVLNVRKTASTKSNVLMKLNRNIKVQVISKGKSWTKIKYNKKTGYVKNEFLSNKKLATSTKSLTSNNKIVENAKKQVGKRYVYGASGPSSFDCSGLVYYVLKQSGKKVNRSSVAGYWSKVKKVSTPQPGDLVFLKNTYKKGPSHVGIYVGNGKYVHASSSKTGVKMDSINSSYVKKHFLGYGRV